MFTTLLQSIILPNIQMIWDTVRDRIIMLCGGRMCYTRQKMVRIFQAHISGHNHNWLLHWFVPCYLQNHALLWQDNWMRFNVEMSGNSWFVWGEHCIVSSVISFGQILTFMLLAQSIIAPYSACLYFLTSYYIC